MKKWICILLATSCVATFAACNDETEEEKNAEIFQTPSKTEMGLYTELSLEVFDDVKDSNVEWESSDTDVLEVVDGVVFAKSQGTASVSAIYDDDEQSLELTVVAAASTPYIDETEMSLIVGGDFTFNPYLYVNGTAFDNATYTVVSSNPSVVSVAEGYVLKANATGETTLSVKANWRGVVDIATASIPCVVNENEGIVPTHKDIVLYDVEKSFRGQNFSNAEELSAQVFSAGEVVENADIVWTSENEDVAIVSGEQLQAKSVGTTKLIGTYTKANGESIQTFVNVAVEYAVLDLNDDLLIGLNETENLVDGNWYFGDGYTASVIEVEKLGKSYAVTDDSVAGTTFGDALAGEYACKIYCAEEQVYCIATLVLADFVIYDNDDFFSAAKYLSSYIAVANDLDDIGERTINITEPNQYGYPKIASAGNFTGTFNGMGHTLSDFVINTANGGIFEGAEGGAVFKNFAMKNVTFTPTGQCSAPLFYRMNGAVFVENVYIEVNDFSTSQSSGGVVAFFYMGGLNVKNCIFEINDLTDNSTNGAICGRSFRTSLSMENSYIITNGKLCSTHPDAYNSTCDAVNAYNGYAYTDAETFKTVYLSGLLDVSEFNKYWNLDKPVPDMSK
ncbi:MAG: hypothetical protein IJA89_07650 [Clostridia bacterium]|nr:hypothetical protein [Clostridia bacterium]